MNTELTHHGVLGMRWGVRRYQPYANGTTSKEVGRSVKLLKGKSRLSSKLDANNKRLAKTRDYKNINAYKKQETKKLGLEARRLALEPKVKKIQIKREVYRKQPNFFERGTLKKAYDLDTKISRTQRRMDIWDKKVSSLEAKSAKILHKIEKYNKKLGSLSPEAVSAGQRYIDDMLSRKPLDDTLTHHGILGMKWGIRRFQNKDGTLTDAGKRRIEQAGTGKNAVTVSYDKNGRVSDSDAAKANKILRESAKSDAQAGKDIASNSASIASLLASKRAEKRKLIAEQTASKMNLSDMSDADLNAAITRMQKEFQYKQLTAQNIERGRSRVDNMLETAGTLLTVTATAASIAVAWHTLHQ